MRARVRAGTSGWRRAAPRPPAAGAEAGYGEEAPLRRSVKRWAAPGLVAIALLVLAYAAVSRRLVGTAITPAIVFVIGGIVASPDVLGWLDPAIRR